MKLNNTQEKNQIQDMINGELHNKIMQLHNSKKTLGNQNLFYGNAKYSTLQDYFINPILHHKIFYPISGVCGRLTDRCYIIELVAKNNKTLSFHKHQFVIGYHVAEEMLKAVGKQNLPLFNPLTNHYESSSQDQRNFDTKTYQSSLNNFTPLEKELYQVLHLILIKYKIQSPSGLFKEILFRLNQVLLYQKNIPDWRMLILLKGLNTSLTSYEETLSEIISDLGKQNIKNYRFPQIKSMGEKYNLQFLKNSP